MEEKKMDGQKPINPNMTLDVKNAEVEQQIKNYLNDKSKENLNILINLIRDSRVLVPAAVNEKKQPVPAMLRTKEDEVYFPVFTSKEQYESGPKSQAIMNMPYLAVNEISLKHKPDLAGIVINPFTDNLTFKRPLVERINIIENAKNNPDGVKEVKLTEEQYVAFERRHFEMTNLPKSFFEKGQEFVDKLCADKEQYIDELFEESYQNKRMYPYLTEEFAVMAMDISDELLVLRVDMPTKDGVRGSSPRIYMTWNKAASTGKYFAIEATSPTTHTITEVMADGQKTNHGEAPVEGAELQTIIDFAGDKKITS